MAFVYILRSGDTNFYKIGRTRRDVELRRKELSTGTPSALSLVTAINTKHDALAEKLLHDKLINYHVNNVDAKEFYHIEDVDKLLDAVKDVKAYLTEFVTLKEEELIYKDVIATGGMLDKDESSNDLHKRLIKIKQDIRMLEASKEIIELRLKQKIKHNKGIKGVATWNTVSRVTFEYTRFRQTHPDLWTEFSVETLTRPFKVL